LPDAEALIREARQRQHRRWFFIATIVVIATVVSGVIYAIVSRPSAKPSPRSMSLPLRTLPQSGPFVSPKAPYALSVAANGDLLAVDTGRDQILRRLPSGKFRVIAGDGKRGFSGDGGPAIRARVNVQGDSGIAVARNGTVYFADTGNGRVREVLPNGIIKTIVGGGTRTLGQGSMPALDASINKQFTVTGLAIGPNGALYIAANAVYRLGLGGLLHWVVGKWVPPKDWPKSWGGVFSNPAPQSDFTGATRLAFDGKGDLFVAGGGGIFGIYEMARNGRLRFVGVFRGDAGGPPALAPATGGSIVVAYNAGIFRVSPSGTRKLISPSAGVGLKSPLSAALGKRNGFVGGDGVAAGRNGNIYVDTNVGNGWTGVSAILELRPNGKVVALWKS
jgi:hypothetical protein